MAKDKDTNLLTNQPFKERLLIAKCAIKESPLAKNGYNSHNKYKYLQLEDMLDIVIPALHNVGLMSKVSVDQANVDYIQEDRLYKVIAKCQSTLTIYDSVTTEFDSITMHGFAINTSQDKALNVAITSASKYAYREYFCLSEQDDQEHDVNDPNLGVITEIPEEAILKNRLRDFYLKAGEDTFLKTLNVYPKDLNDVHDINILRTLVSKIGEN